MPTISDDEMRANLQEMDSAILYDVFFDTNTMLSGFLLALERYYRKHGDIVKAKKIRQENHAIIDEREAVNPYDSETQINYCIIWTHKIDELDRLLNDLKQ